MYLYSGNVYAYTVNTLQPPYTKTILTRDKSNIFYSCCNAFYNIPCTRFNTFYKYYNNCYTCYNISLTCWSSYKTIFNSHKTCKSCYKIYSKNNYKTRDVLSIKGAATVTRGVSTIVTRVRVIKKHVATSARRPSTVITVFVTLLTSLATCFVYFLSFFGLFCVSFFFAFLFLFLFMLSHFKPFPPTMIGGSNTRVHVFDFF